LQNIDKYPRHHTFPPTPSLDQHLTHTFYTPLLVPVSSTFPPTSTVALSVVIHR
jgi:hypothetical protein